MDTETADMQRKVIFWRRACYALAIVASVLVGMIIADGVKLLMCRDSQRAAILNAVEQNPNDAMARHILRLQTPEE